VSNEKSVFAIYDVAALEGQRLVVPHRIFSHRRHATCYIDGKTGGPGELGAWKPNDTSWTYHQLPLYDSVESAIADEFDVVRSRALAKLDPHERRALGIY